MKKNITLLLLVSSALFLFGCATVGNKFNVSAISSLEEGKTTEQQAIMLLGSQPTHRQKRLMNAPNPESWTKGDYFLGWKFAQGNAFGRGQGASLVLMFDNKKILKEIVSQSSINLTH